LLCEVDQVLGHVAGKARADYLFEHVLCWLVDFGPPGFDGRLSISVADGVTQVTVDSRSGRWGMRIEFP
jgi:hypothetical protein